MSSFNLYPVSLIKIYRIARNDINVLSASFNDALSTHLYAIPIIRMNH